MQMDYDKLKVILESIDFKPINSFISESNPIEALKINFNPESRDENLEMIFTLFSPQDISALLREKTEFYFLNMTCFLPITFDGISIKEAKLLANRINAIALLPGFCVDDNSQQVFYRYSLPLILDSNQNLLKAFINLSMNMIDVYGDPFIQIAAGESYENFIRECFN